MKQSIAPLVLTLSLGYFSSFFHLVQASPLNDGNIKTAVKLWVDDPSSAQSTYGHISSWNTSAVTDMSSLFDSCGGHLNSTGCSCNSFNEVRCLVLSLLM